jgi:hypothetical protein
MKNSFKLLAIPTVLCSALFLTACNNSSEHSEEVSPEDKVMQELATDPVKEFAKTANDKHDIQLLLDYDARYTEISDAMEDELEKLNKQGNVDKEFVYNRKKDILISASEMLKTLDLKTEQGRYIQGLIASYWEEQSQLLEKNKDKVSTEQDLSEDNFKGLGKYLQAQEQLDNWHSQYPELESKSDH